MSLKSIPVKFFFVLAAMVLLHSVGAFAQVHTSGTYRYLLTKGETLSHLEYLTSEEVEGRGAGTPGAKKVADYIAGKMESFGLKPLWSVSFLQPFSLPGGNGSSQGNSYLDQYRKVTGSVAADAAKGYNVVGYLPSGRKDAPFIVIGAHFDHIGKIDGKIYPGADDNASGVAALLELARMFGQRYLEKGDLNHNLVFVAFDGNNYSLSGSRYFATMKGIPPGKISCMINIDQVGSVLVPPGENPEYMLVLGSNRLKGWQREQLDFANDYFGIGLDLDYTYYGSPDFYDIFYKLSDQQSFTQLGVPALLFTSGITKFTNKEGDSIENLSLDVLLKRIDLIYRFIWLIE